jgi:heat shock protein HtpX
MAIGKRILLFLVVNILITLTISILLKVFGIEPYLQASGLNYGSLAVTCLLWGMVGSFISLALSRIMAKWTMGVRLIDPQTAAAPTETF